MNKFDSNQYQQNYLRLRHFLDLTKSRVEAAQQDRLKQSEEVFSKEGITFDKRRGRTWLVTVEGEKFDYDAKDGHWRPVGKSKWYSSCSATAFLNSVRNFQSKHKKQCSN